MFNKIEEGEITMLYDIDRFKKRDNFNQGFWDGFTNRDVMKDYRVSDQTSEPAVNVLEDTNEYQLQLIAPGLCRDNYTIQVHDDILDVKADLPEKKHASKFQRQEYSPGSFQRSFVIPKHVKHETISASCTDGILTIHLPVTTKEKENNTRSIEII